MLRACAGLVVLGVAALAATASADDEAGSGDPFASVVAGTALGFGIHESGHVALDVAFDARPHFAAVDFHGIPFFAIGHDPVPARQEALISWAGFATQHAGTEWILTRERHLRHRRAPFRKGFLAFHVLCSAAYGVGAFGKTGPAERDTRGIARSVDVDERVIGVFIVAPAALDTYRYFHPEARWAPWASRALKVGLAVLVLK